MVETLQPKPPMRPWHQAVDRSSSGLRRLETGKCLDHKNRQGLTPLMLASAAGCVHLLVPPVISQAVCNNCSVHAAVRPDRNLCFQNNGSHWDDCHP